MLQGRSGLRILGIVGLVQESYLYLQELFLGLINYGQPFTFLQLDYLSRMPELPLAS